MQVTRNEKGDQLQQAGIMQRSTGKHQAYVTAHQVVPCRDWEVQCMPVDVHAAWLLQMWTIVAMRY
jgi:hypothetical protein